MRYIQQIVRSYFNGTKTKYLSEVTLKPANNNILPEGEILGLIHVPVPLSLEHKPVSISTNKYVDDNTVSVFLSNRLLLAVLRRYFHAYITAIEAILNVYRSKENIKIIDILIPEFGWLCRTDGINTENKDNNITLLVKQVAAGGKLDMILKSNKYTSKKVNKKSFKLPYINAAPVYATPSKSVEFGDLNIPLVTRELLAAVQLCIYTKDPLSSSNSLLVCVLGVVEGMYSGFSVSSSREICDQLCVYFHYNKVTIKEHTLTTIEYAKDRFTSFREWSPVPKSTEAYNHAMDSILSYKILIGPLDETIIYIPHDTNKSIVTEPDIYIIDLYQVPDDVYIPYIKPDYSEGFIVITLPSGIPACVFTASEWYLDKLLRTRQGSFIKNNIVYKNKPALQFVGFKPNVNFTKIKPDDETLNILNINNYINNKAVYIAPGWYI